MAPEDVQWAPAVAVLLVGLVLGSLLVLWARRRAVAAPPAPEPAPLAVRDLDGRVESLLQQLRELEDTAAKRTPAQLAHERYALELAAAQALLAREALMPKAKGRKMSGQHVPTAAAVETPAGAQAASGERGGFLAEQPALRGFLWGVGSVAVLVTLGLLAWRGAQPRQEGGSLTGNAPRQQAAAEGASSSGPSSSGPASPAQEADEARLRAALARDPDDVNARMDLARSLLMRQDLMGVWNETQYVLTRTPGQPRALAYQALVRLAMGQGDLAVDMLKRARSAAPDLVEAYQHLVYVYASLGRTAEAEATIVEADRRFPGIGESLRSALAQLQRERNAAGTAASAAPAGENPHARVAPPATREQEGPADQSARAAAASVGSVSGVIEAGPSVQARIAPGTVVFVIVREAGVEQGPPVAAKRLLASSFPLQFFVGPADSMMGQPLPERMRIEARADLDGDPTTRSAADPQAHLDGVRAGASGLRLALR